MDSIEMQFGIGPMELLILGGVCFLPMVAVLVVIFVLLLGKKKE